MVKQIAIASKAERLFRLFDHAGRRNGCKRLAAELGRSETLLWRWVQPKGTARGAKGGAVPPEYNQQILEAADRLDIDRAEIAPCLDLHICPTCKRPMPAGRRW